MSKFIHLLYVPTRYCNMNCRYCYLGENTVEREDGNGYLETLEYAVKKLRESDVIPFNISLHGGEVTTLPPDEFRIIISYISDYYEKNGQMLSENGFTVKKPHIKTNLYSIAKHIDTLREYGVSVSGSLDLPLSLHDSYRVSKGGKGTLETILRNIDLLKSLPNSKKVSCTIFKEHFDRLDEIVSDIHYLAEHTCLDMNDFNFMIGFKPDSESDVKFTALDEDCQVALYQRMKDEFEGTFLEAGLKGAWFAEFTPDYCTNCDNCGEKFFLLERNGDVYSCVRGQGNQDFYYGNIYRDSVETILSNGRAKIFLAHSRVGFSEECGQCEYLHLCKTGCPYVKNIYRSPKSYTCKLQQELYRDFRYSLMPGNYTYLYLRKLHPELADAYMQRDVKENSLPDLISRDPKLQMVYDSSSFILSVDGVEHGLESQLLKRTRDIIFITETSSVKVYVKHETMNYLSDYPINNALYIMLLSGDTVIYGDEQRSKQAHIMTHQIFHEALVSEPSDKEGYYCADISVLLSLYGSRLSKTSPNNLFFTTIDLRDYHYTKQRNNGFYHYNALNLPFQNIELYYFSCKDMEIMIHD